MSDLLRDPQVLFSCGWELFSHGFRNVTLLTWLLSVFFHNRWMLRGKTGGTGRIQDQPRCLGICDGEWGALPALGMMESLFSSSTGRNWKLQETKRYLLGSEKPRFLRKRLLPGGMRWRQVCWERAMCTDVILDDIWVIFCRFFKQLPGHRIRKLICEEGR